MDNKNALLSNTIVDRFTHKQLGNIPSFTISLLRPGLLNSFQ